MASKKPRRTAERILEDSLAVFNRLGEPNVSASQLAAALGLSPGNLYYHYPGKEAIVAALYQRYEDQMAELLPAAQGVRDVEDAWLFFHMLFELVWRWRFIYRDLNDLLSRHRCIEARFPVVLQAKTRAVQQVIAALAPQAPGNAEAAPLPTAIVVVLTWWLSYEYVRDPRRALEPEAAAASMARGAQHVLGLLVPWLAADAREHLQALVLRYREEFTPSP